MVRKKRSKSKKKSRTISPEHQQKMQAARKAARVHEQRMSQLSASGLNMTESMSKTERMLKSVARK